MSKDTIWMGEETSDNKEKRFEDATLLLPAKCIAHLIENMIGTEKQDEDGKRWKLEWVSITKENN